MAFPLKLSLFFPPSPRRKIQSIKDRHPNGAISSFQNDAISSFQMTPFRHSSLSKFCTREIRVSCSVYFDDPGSICDIVASICGHWQEYRPQSIYPNSTYLVYFEFRMIFRMLTFLSDIRIFGFLPPRPDI